MKTYWLLIIAGIILGNPALGQQKLTGKVTDGNTGQAIALVNVTSDQGRGGTTTDSDGWFSISIRRFPIIIRFSHIAFEVKEVSLTEYSADTLRIQLEPKTESIREVVVEGGRYIQVLKRQNFYVIDYEFDQDKIWVIGYAGKSVLNPQLILLTLTGAVLEKKPMDGISKLYKDAFGRVHLVGKKSISVITSQGDHIQVGEAKLFTGWEQNLFDLQLVLGKSGIFKWVYNNGIFCEYAYVDFRDTAAVVIHKSYDRELFSGEEPAKRFRHSSIPDIPSAPWGSGYDPDLNSPFLARAQQQIDYRPLITHIFRFRNNYLIFEDRGCQLWKYDITFRDPANLRIALPKNAKNTDLLQDPVTGNLYLNYSINSNGYLAGIDPESGAILFSRKIDKYLPGDAVKVYDDRAWFTHQGNNGSTLMNLYSTEIRGN